MIFFSELDCLCDPCSDSRKLLLRWEGGNIVWLNQVWKEDSFDIFFGGFVAMGGIRSFEGSSPVLYFFERSNAGKEEARRAD